MIFSFPASKLPQAVRLKKPGPPRPEAERHTGVGLPVAADQGVTANRPDSRGTRVMPMRATPPPAMSCFMPWLLAHYG